MLNVLLVCTGNTCRSPMAAALLIKQLQARPGALPGKSIEVSSAGLSAMDGWPASPEAIQTMQAEGIDISQHRSQSLRAALVEEADLVLTMTAWQRDRLQEEFAARAHNIFSLSEFCGEKAEDIQDPFGLDMAAYRSSLNQLKVLVDKLYVKLNA